MIFPFCFYNKNDLLHVAQLHPTLTPTNHTLHISLNHYNHLIHLIFLLFYLMRL